MSPPVITVEAYPDIKSLYISSGLVSADFSKAVRGSMPKISTSRIISWASMRIEGINSTLESLLILMYGDIPPVAITEIYAAAKGISLSKARPLSPAFIDGVTIKIIIM